MNKVSTKVVRLHIDVVISNGTINLAPSKQNVFFEKSCSGGESWANCAARTLKSNELIQMIEEAAFNKIKLLNSILIVFTFFLANAVNSEPYTAHVNYSYHVDFDNTQSQTEALNTIQKQIKNKTNEEELKIILFGKGRALSLDANALNNTKIEYGNTDKAVQKKMSELNEKGIRLIICKAPKNSRRHYSTNPAGTTVEKELKHLESRGYNCN